MSSWILKPGFLQEFAMAVFFFFLIMKLKIPLNLVHTD